MKHKASLNFICNGKAFDKGQALSNDDIAVIGEQLLSLIQDKCIEVDPTIELQESNESDVQNTEPVSSEDPVVVAGGTDEASDDNGLASDASPEEETLVEEPKSKKKKK
jgi:hypothetical protein